jgi:hypothetical protein
MGKTRNTESSGGFVFGSALIPARGYPRSQPRLDYHFGFASKPNLEKKPLKSCQEGCGRQPGGLHSWLRRKTLADAGRARQQINRKTFTENELCRLPCRRERPPHLALAHAEDREGPNFCAILP